MKEPAFKARWISNYSPCYWCGAKAVGMLMSDRNDKLGSACKKCSDKFIKQFQQYLDSLQKKAS